MAETFAHIKGLEGLQAALSRLPGVMQERLAVRAVSAAAKVVQDAIKARAPRRQEGGAKAGKGKSRARNSGNLARHISRKRIGKKSGTQVAYTVFPSPTAFYGKFVEEGHGPPNSRHRQREATYQAEFGGRSTPAHPFMRPAMDSSQSASVDKFAEVMRAGLAEAVEDAKR
jgi:HK97 gp10 family phage protein